MDRNYIEREIVTGLIVSTDYLQKFTTIFKSAFIQSKTAQRIVNWCLGYYDKYETAPGMDISRIYESKLRSEQLDDDEAKYVERVLSLLSDNYGTAEQQQAFNSTYLHDETKRYFKERALEILSEDIEADLSNDAVEDAEQRVITFNEVADPPTHVIDPFANENSVREAFTKAEQPLFTLPGALGWMMNQTLAEDSFIGFMGPEKRGKTQWLQEMNFRALLGGQKTAFFSAGDMSQNQMQLRNYIYMARRSNRAKYCGWMLRPTLDCILNQTGKCERSERECSFGVFENLTEKQIRKLHYEDYEQAWRHNPEYAPCRICYRNNPVRFRGAIWYRERPPVRPLTWKEAIDTKERFFKMIGGPAENRSRLAVYPPDSLSIREVKRQLDEWAKRDGFIPRVIIIDYMDLLFTEKRLTQSRDIANQIWKEGRNLSMDRHACVISATQSDAESYDQHTLRMSNFSEDKRKLGHVVGMYGINQTFEERKLGVQRINEIVVREDELYADKQVTVLQKFQIGKPYIASYMART